MIDGLFDHHFQDALKDGFTLQDTYFFDLFPAQKFIQLNGCSGLKEDKGDQHPCKEKLLHMHIKRVTRMEAKIDNFKMISNLLRCYAKS
jgi:hypothetical protein